MRATGLLLILMLGTFLLLGPAGLARGQTVVRFQTTFGDVDVAGLPISAAGLAKCDTIDLPGSCDVQDLVVLRRALAGLFPEIAPVCPGA